jgi:CheY-like chemotaxis protein
VSAPGVFNCPQTHRTRFLAPGTPQAPFTHSSDIETSRAALRDRGYPVEYAINGYAAIAAAKKFKPAVVLLDLGLPGMDGFEVVCRRIRAEKGLEQTRVIAVTAYGQPEYRRRSLEAGCVAHFVKPISVDQLIRPSPEISANRLGVGDYACREIKATLLTILLRNSSRAALAARWDRNRPAGAFRPERYLPPARTGPSEELPYRRSTFAALLPVLGGCGRALLAHRRAGLPVAVSCYRHSKPFLRSFI